MLTFGFYTMPTDTLSFSLRYAKVIGPLGMLPYTLFSPIGQGGRSHLHSVCGHDISGKILPPKTEKNSEKTFGHTHASALRVGDVCTKCISHRPIRHATTGGKSSQRMLKPTFTHLHTLYTFYNRLSQGTRERLNPKYVEWRPLKVCLCVQVHMSACLCGSAL